MEEDLIQQKLEEERSTALKDQEIEFMKEKLDELSKEKTGLVSRYEQKISKLFTPFAFRGSSCLRGGQGGVPAPKEHRAKTPGKGKEGTSLPARGAHQDCRRPAEGS